LQGADSLLSIVQMPSGIPVATVAIDNARNAGLLAVRMLGIADPSLRAALRDHADELAAMARAQTEGLGSQ
jgi:5-(carboxyamino)imidazole ribonucleotide mutase